MDHNELLQKTYELAEENNKILRGIRRSNRMNGFWHIFYWVVIVAISVAAYYYLAPYTNNLTKMYQTAQTEMNTINSTIKSLPSFSTTPTK